MSLGPRSVQDGGNFCALYEMNYFFISFNVNIVVFRFMFCVTNMSVTMEQLRLILDEKLTPLKLEIDDLRTKLSEAIKFLDFASTKCNEVIIQLAKQEQENKSIHIHTSDVLELLTDLWLYNSSVSRLLTFEK